jgi:hypothetical protein
MLAMVLPSYTGDDAVETTLVMVWCRYWGDVGHGVMSLLSLADDDIAEDDVGYGMMSLSSHADDDTV